MSPALEAFLAAEDLDDLLKARMEIKALDAEDEIAIRSVLNEWRDSQAVSNLLFHPTLIPRDIRLASLFKGLAERQVVYYVLAAVVGFQSVDPEGLSDEDRQRVLTELLAVRGIATGIVAQRASMSFDGFAAPGDSPLVFSLMEHADATVRHNLRAWLFRVFKDAGVEPLAAAGRRSGLSEDAQRRMVGEFAELLAAPPREFDGRLFPRLGYIPNLRDVMKKG